MSENITVTNVRRNYNPSHEKYAAYVEVDFSTGVRVRHALATDGRYLEQIFLAEDYDSVYDDALIEDDFDVNDLDGYVLEWMDVTMEEINSVSGSSWDQFMIRNEESPSATNLNIS